LGRNWQPGRLNGWEKDGNQVKHKPSVSGELGIKKAEEYGETPLATHLKGDHMAKKSNSAEGYLGICLRPRKTESAEASILIIARLFYDNPDQRPDSSNL